MVRKFLDAASLDIGLKLLPGAKRITIFGITE
jgi:hypothetical protein